MRSSFEKKSKCIREPVNFDRFSNTFRDVARANICVGNTAANFSAHFADKFVSPPGSSLCLSLILAAIRRRQSISLSSQTEAEPGLHSYLTEHLCWLLLESQPLNKIVNLRFTITI